MQNSVHILGAGLAGWNLAQEIRKLDSQIKITIICADSGDFYNKILLSTMFEKNAEPDDLITQTGAEKAKELDVNLLANTEVISIDSKAKCLILKDNSQIAYEKLVLATGAEPIKLPFLQNNKKIFFVNNLDEYRIFKQNLQPNFKVGILGAGLVGVEFAHDLLSSEVKPYLISNTPNILANLAPQEVSEPLLETLKSAGLQAFLGVNLQAVSEKSNKLILELLKTATQTSENLEVDILLSAIGLRVATNLAESANCEIENDAIKVNKKLQTTQKDIYAFGDCASIEGKKLMFVEPLLQSARVLANNLHYKEQEKQQDLSLPSLPVIIKSSRYPLTSAMPNADCQGQWQIEKSATGVNAKFFAKDAKLLGFALSGSEVRYTNRLAKQLPRLF